MVSADKRIRSGELMQSVEIHAQSSTRNELREKVDSWSKITNGDWRVKVTTQRGSEGEARSGQMGNTVYEVKGYYRDDITAQHRLVWGSEILDILHIEDVEQRNEVLIIEAESITRSGSLRR